MNKFATIAALAGAATAMTASADVLLDIDLSVANQITITATDGLAAADASSSNFTGMLMAGFFNDSSFGSGTGSGTGDLSTANNPSDGSPSLFSGTSDFGLNLWSFSTESTVTMTSGTIAMSGAATWTVGAAEYAAMLAGNTSGDLYFGADTDDDIGVDGVLVGTWNVVPAPSSAALLGLGGMLITRRRRA